MIPREVSQPFYKSTRWKKCRQGYIHSVGGLCERCLKKGIIRQGYIVHHKQYVTEENITDPDVTLNWANLEYLCHECHNHEHFGESKTTREDVQFDPNGNLIEKVPPPLKIIIKGVKGTGGNLRIIHRAFLHEGGGGKTCKYLIRQRRLIGRKSD